MNRTVPALFGIALALSGGSQINACTMEPIPNWRDKPISIMPDGSFDQAEESIMDIMSGRVPLDI